MLNKYGENIEVGDIVNLPVNGRFHGEEIKIIEMNAFKLGETYTITVVRFIYITGNSAGERESTQVDDLRLTKNYLKKKKLEGVRNVDGN